MFWLSPGLAALALIPVPFVVVVATRYGHRSRPALQEVQQRIAEVTADVEENISGVRVVKAFAAEPRQLDRFRGNVGAGLRPVDGRDPAARLLQPVPGLPAEPRPGRDPARRRAPGRQRDADARRLHRVLHVPADADRADADVRRRAGDGPARDRLGRAAVRDPRPRAADRRRRRSAAARARARRAARRDLRLRQRPGRAARRVADRRAGLDGRARGRDRVGQDDARPAAAAAVRPALGRGADRRRGRPRRRRRRRCAARSRSSTTTRSCSRTRSRATSPTRGRTPRSRRSSWPRSARRRRASSTSCPTATTRASASAA